MKNVSLALLLSSAVLFGCSKSTTVNNPYYGEDYGPFTFKVDDVRDTTLEQSDEVVMIVKVSKLSGPANSVKLTATGLPEGMSIKFDPASAEPPYNAIVNIKTDRVKTGIYPIVIEAYNKDAGTLKYPMSVQVTPYSKPSVALAGNYNTTGACTPQTGPLGHDSKIELVEGSNNRIKIFGFWSPSWNIIIEADIDINKSTINIPSQVAGGLTYVGTGTFDRSTITVNYTVSGQVVNETCTATLTRQ